MDAMDDFSDTDEGIMKDGLNSFQHKPLISQKDQLSSTTYENSNIQNSSMQTPSQNKSASNQHQYRRPSPQKQSLDVKPSQVSPGREGGSIDPEGFYG